MITKNRKTLMLSGPEIWGAYIIRIKKSAESVVEVCTQLRLMIVSGFIDIFCIGGILQQSFFTQIHDAFVNQFKGSEINAILNSIQHANKDNLEAAKTRTVDTFIRVAIRTLYQNLLSAKKSSFSDLVEEVKINNVEHFYRRTMNFKVWTGDIFRNITTDTNIFILTPRCDINNNSNNGKFLACSIESIDEKRIREIHRDGKKLADYLNDNPQNTGIKYRYLMPNPLFGGGKVNLSDYFTIDAKVFENPDTYQYLISCSDELTNDIIRKFSSYILRGGVSATDIVETAYYTYPEHPRHAEI